MTSPTERVHRGRGSRLWVAASLGLAVTILVVLDAVVVLGSREAPSAILANVVLFNGGAILQACAGAVIEWRRPGHRVGRLLMIIGPMYAGLAVLWMTADRLAPMMGPQVEGIVGMAGVLLSYAGVALMIAGLPLIFPTGTLPSPGWRRPVGAFGGVFVAGLVAMATRPGPVMETNRVNPFGLQGWPSVLQPLVDLIPIELLCLVLLGLASLIGRYRGGDQVIRHQLKWFAGAVTVILLGFTGVVVELAVRTDSGPLVSGMVAYAGILLMPVAVGVAVLRYRLYEIDRLISRTLSWGLLTVILVGVYASAVLVLQGALAGVTQGQTLAVAASTLFAAALFQPLRRGLQQLLDRRFDRAGYDAELTATAFAARLRDQVDLARLGDDIEFDDLTLTPTGFDRALGACKSEQRYTVSGRFGRAEQAGLAVSLLAALVSAAVWLFTGNVTGGPLGIAVALVTAASQLVWWSVGAVIILRAGRRRIGWIVLAGATFGSIAMASVGILGPGMSSGNPTDSPVATWAFLAVGATYGPWFICLIVAGMLLFPDGQLPGPRWRLPVGLALSVVAAGTLAYLITPGPLFPNLPDNPLGIPLLPREPLAVLRNLVPVGIVAAALLGAGSMLVRFRRADPLVRHQLKWLLAAVLPAALSTPLAFTDNDQATTTVADLVQLTSLLVLMPASIGIAITRYRLYEIDRLVSRGLAWGLLTALLVGVYTAGVLVLQGILAGVTQGETLAVAASTLLAAALFQPMRQRLQRLLDHRFDRGRYDIERTVGAFSARLRDQVDLNSVRVEISSAIQASLRPGSTSIWVREARRP